MRTKLLLLTLKVCVRKPSDLTSYKGQHTFLLFTSRRPSWPNALKYGISHLKTFLLLTLLMLQEQRWEVVSVECFVLGLSFTIYAKIVPKATIIIILLIFFRLLVNRGISFQLPKCRSVSFSCVFPSFIKKTIAHFL